MGPVSAETLQHKERLHISIRSLSMTVEFSDFNLHPALMQALTELGYTTPTPIQSGMIPLMLSGVDVIGQAQTGTGKTAAFGPPIITNYKSLHNPQAFAFKPHRE